MTTVSLSFAVGVAFIDPVVPIDPVFLDLMQYYCDIEQMQKGAVSSSSYGHKTISRDVVVQTFREIRCRLRVMSTEEIEETSRAGETVSDYIMYVPFGYLPTGLRESKAALPYRVVNVRTLQGVPEEAGPYDIQGIKLMAGEHHHYQVRLRKIN